MITQFSEKTLYDLSQFFGANFHQDWMEEYSTPDDLLAGYRDEASTEWLHGLVTNLTLLLSDDLEEEELQKFLFEDCDCNYDVLEDWASAKDWIRHIIELFSQNTINYRVAH